MFVIPLRIATCLITVSSVCFKSRPRGIFTLDRRQSKTLILETVRNRVFDCNLSPIPIENTVSSDFAPRSSIVESVFDCRLSGVIFFSRTRYDPLLLTNISFYREFVTAFHHENLMLIVFSSNEDSGESGHILYADTPSFVARMIKVRV